MLKIFLSACLYNDINDNNVNMRDTVFVKWYRINPAFKAANL